MRAKRICANTFPDTDKREIGILLTNEHDDLGSQFTDDLVINPKAG